MLVSFLGFFGCVYNFVAVLHIHWRPRTAAPSNVLRSGSAWKLLPCVWVLFVGLQKKRSILMCLHLFCCTLEVSFDVFQYKHRSKEVSCDESTSLWLYFQYVGARAQQRLRKCFEVVLLCRSLLWVFFDMCTFLLMCVRFFWCTWYALAPAHSSVNECALKWFTCVGLFYRSPL